MSEMGLVQSPSYRPKGDIDHVAYKGTLPRTVRGGLAPPPACGALAGHSHPQSS
jgi:hypothetical protein